MAYISSHKNQNWLIPQSIKEMIPKEHICFFVEEFIESLDYSKFDMIYAGAGHPAYHPRILIKTIIMGMLSRIRSSRKLASATRESFIFMYLAEKVNPDFRTIARFRKDNAVFIKDTFKDTIKLASDYKIIDLSFIGIDGSKMKAYAGKKQYFDKEGLDKLDKAIDKMLEEDIALDEVEEQIFGDKEEGITGMDERDLRKVVRESFKSKDKTKMKQKIARAREELEQNNLKKVSLSDPESRVMQHAKKYSEPCYNTQFSVTKNQIIIANDVCQDGHDAHQFIPQMKNVKENIKLKKETKVGVDCGYSDGINIKSAEDNKIDLYVPSRARAQEFDGKEQSLNHDKYEYDERKDEIIAGGIRYPYHHSYVRRNSGKKMIVYQLPGAKQRKQVPEFFRERLRMRDKMEKPESKDVYRLRKCTVEPVIGNIKQNLGFREFLLKGLPGTKIEMNLVGIAHNLGKIWRLTRISEC